jgi:hypothetical protein
MAVTRSNEIGNKAPFAKYNLVDPSGNESKHEVYEGSHYRFSWYDGGRKNEIFHVGGGSPHSTETPYQLDFGTYRLTPLVDFFAWADIWGAGGGNYNSGNDSSRGGGGGFAKALIQFKANIPYALVVGQGGRSRDNVGSNTTTHGGGGGGGTGGGGGQGGGLSGIFMNSNHIGRSNWEHSPPVSQAQALVISGGGGGPGHHSMGHHGNGGGGGGRIGRAAHNSSGGTQFYPGHYNNYSHHNLGSGQQLHGGRGSQQGTWVGGGGGGWFGGGGGAHSGGSNHHNGGSGGSGHIATPVEFGLFPNNDKSKFIYCGNMETSPSAHNSGWRYAANYKSRLAYRSSSPSMGEDGGFYAGKGGRGNNSLSTNGDTSALHGKIVLTLVPHYVAEFYKKQVVTDEFTTEWTNQDVYTEN